MKEASSFKSKRVWYNQANYYILQCFRFWLKRVMQSECQTGLRCPDTKLKSRSIIKICDSAFKKTSRRLNIDITLRNGGWPTITRHSIVVRHSAVVILNAAWALELCQLWMKFSWLGSTCVLESPNGDFF